jgi:hypothetical protein
MEADPPLHPAGGEDWARGLHRRCGLPRILELIEESTRRDAEKAAEWKHEAQLQELLIDAISSFDKL